MTLRQHLSALAILIATCFVAPAYAEESTTPTPVITGGVNHIGLTVSDLEASASFFIDTLGWEQAGGDPDYPAVFVTDGEAFVTLWRAEDPESATPFDRRKNLGLHHLAITVRYIEDLNALHTKLATMQGVTIEFAPETLGGGPTIHMMIREPSGLRLEFITPRGRSKTDAE